MTGSRERRTDNIGGREHFESGLPSRSIHRLPAVLLLVHLSRNFVVELIDSTSDATNFDVEFGDERRVVLNALFLDEFGVSILPQAVDLASDALNGSSASTSIARTGDAIELDLNQLIDEDIPHADIDRCFGTDTDDLGDVGRAIALAHALFQALDELVDSSVTWSAKEEVTSSVVRGFARDEGANKAKDRARLACAGRPV